MSGECPPLTKAEMGKSMTELNDELRGEPAQTYRSVADGIEPLLHKPFKVLDHGFIRVVDYMGDDAAVVQAARVSYGRGTKQKSQDQGLINYLMRHFHTTPFEMAEIKIHVKLPIFVARQWIRHRTASVNEYSARYSILDREFYIPDRDALASQSTSNRQGRSDILDHAEATKVLDILRGDAERNYDHYIELLNADGDGNPIDDSRLGLSRELARINLPLNFYTQWYWKTNLHNLMNFLRLRADSHAQHEIREYADVLMNIMEQWVPLTHAAFKEYRMNSVQLSATALTVVRRMLAGEIVTELGSGLNKREWNDLMSALNK